MRKEQMEIIQTIQIMMARMIIVIQTPIMTVLRMILRLEMIPKILWIPITMVSRTTRIAIQTMMVSLMI